MKKILMALRIEPGLKMFLKEHADKDHRSLSNFLIHAATLHIKEKKGVDWEDVRLDYIKAAEKADDSK
jgi:hypothetical protein